MAVISPRRARVQQGSLAARRGLCLVVVWWAMTDGVLDAWPIGAVCVALALIASLRLAPWSVGRIRPLGVVAFIPYFLAKTVSGSVDVARRALHPRLPIDPALLYYRLQFPGGPGRLLFAGTVNLLPGTAVAEIEADRLRIHVIDRGRPLDAELAPLERRCAAVFAAGEPG